MLEVWVFFDKIWLEYEFLALIVVEIPQQAWGKAWREELQRKAGSRLLKIYDFSVFLFFLNLFYFSGNDVVIEQWCGFYDYIVRRNAPSFEIVAANIFHKIVDVERDFFFHGQ